MARIVFLWFLAICHSLSSCYLFIPFLIHFDWLILLRSHYYSSCLIDLHWLANIAIIKYYFHPEIIFKLQKLHMSSTGPTNFNQPQSLVKYSNPVLVSSSGKKQVKVCSITLRMPNSTLKISPTPTPRTSSTPSYPHDNTPLKSNNSGTSAFTQDSVSLSNPSHQARCPRSSGKIRQKIATKTSKRNRNLSHQIRTLQSMFWRTYQANHHQLRRKRTSPRQSQRLNQISTFHFIQTIQSYQTLYESSIAFGMRQALQA